MIIEPRRFYLHVGAAKTGTSYIQGVLWASQDVLRRQGVGMVPPRRPGHFNLAVNMAGKMRPTDPPAILQADRRFAHHVARHDLPVALFSQELMGPADSASMARLSDLLDGYEVHVVVTMRDLGRLLSSSWQQNVKQRSTRGYDVFLDAVSSRTGSPFFVNGQDLISLVTRWGELVPADRVHVVLGPPSGSRPELLVERFCEALGIDHRDLRYPQDVANPALGAVQAELLRRVNIALGDRLPHPREGYREVGKQWLSSQVLLRQHGERLRVPSRHRAWVEQTTQRWIDFLDGSGVHVVGDPNDLWSPAHAFADDDHDRHNDESALLDAAVHALADILELRDAERRERGWDPEQEHDERSTREKVVDRLQRVRARVSDR